MQNGARHIWVTETALTTALNTSYMAAQLGLFGIVVGIALLLSGFGFAILAIGGALRNPETVLSFAKQSTEARLRAMPVRASQPDSTAGREGPPQGGPSASDSALEQPCSSA